MRRLFMRVLATVALAPMLVAGCTDATPATSVAPATTAVSLDPATVLASSSAVGGLCPEGVCSSAFIVHADGSWTATRGDEVVGSGLLEAATLRELVTATATTTIAQAPPFTGTCPIAYDGAELIYTWTSPDGVEHRASACEREIPDDDPLVVAFALALAEQGTNVSP